MAMEITGSGKDGGSSWMSKSSIAERVARLDVLDADDGGDVARVNGIEFLALVGLDLDEAADAVALVGARIVNRGALGELAGIDAEEDELADEGIGPELERERTELGVVVRGGRDFFLAVVRVDAHGRGNVERAGEIIDDGVDQELDALVLEGGTADDGDKLVGDGQAADAGLELDGWASFPRGKAADFLVLVGDGFDEVLEAFSARGLSSAGSPRRVRRSSRSCRCRDR
jgi:hypothetical protein